MNCPKCHREMMEILSEGVPIDFCTSCKGSFLEKDETAPFAGQPEAFRKAVDAGVRNPAPAAFDCPKCGSKMKEGWVMASDFVLDRCDGCGGLWFDSRELSRLKKLQPDPSPTTPRVVPMETPPQRLPDPPPQPGDSMDRLKKRVGADNPSGMLCPSCKQPPRASDTWQCRCGFQWHAIGTAGVCPRCRRTWAELQCLRCAAWAPPAKWLRAT